MSYDYKDKLCLAISENPEPFFKRIVPEINIEPTGSNAFLEPCPRCHHHKCCAITAGQPYINCFSPECDLKGYIMDSLIRKLGLNAREVYTIASEIYGIDIPDTHDDRIQAIRALAFKHYNNELKNNDQYLKFQLEDRGHQVETIDKFMVGVSSNFDILSRNLRDKGYRDEEIEEAKVKVRGGELLFVYPYINWKTGEIIRFNTKGIPDEAGNKPLGFSTSPKACYVSPEISKDRVIIVEGENDLLSLWEAGETSIIALGGNPSKDEYQEMTDLVDKVASVYIMVDTDNAGKAYISKINQVLPHKMVYLVQYDAKDPDDLLKRSELRVSLEELFNSASLLHSEGYHLRNKGRHWVMATREVTLSLNLICRDKDRDFRGDIEIRTRSGVQEIKLNAALSKLRHKHVPDGLVYNLHKELSNNYDVHISDNDLLRMIECYHLSLRQNQIVDNLAKYIYENGNLEKNITIIAAKLGNSVRDQVLKAINECENKELDLDRPFPAIKIAQSFHVADHDAFYYFTRVARENEDIVNIPYLLSNKRELIRLDLLKKKSPQSVLLIKGKYKILKEVSSSIGEIQQISLHQKWVDKYIAGEIEEAMIRPRLMIRRLERIIRRYFYFPDQKTNKVLALWIFGTYAYELFSEYPYLLLNGKKGTGKSTLDSIIEAYSFNANHINNVTEASLFRAIAEIGGTFILDEMENLSNAAKNNDSGIVGVIKGGYSKNAGKALRCDTEDFDKQRLFDAYSPKVISNINGLDFVIYDRVIEISMQDVDLKELEQQKLDSISDDLSDNLMDIKNVTSLCCLSVLHNFEEIHGVYRGIRSVGTTARMTQIMRPLIALATIAGEDYIEAFEQYYKEKILPAKTDMEEASYTGVLGKMVKDLAQELSGRKPFELCMEFLDYNLPDNAKIILKEDTFSVSQFYFWLLLKTVFPKLDSDIKNIHKWIKHIGPKEILQRTTISWVPPDHLKMRIEENKFSSRRYVFSFDSLLDNWNTSEIVEKLPAKGKDAFLQELNDDSYSGKNSSVIVENPEAIEEGSSAERPQGTSKVKLWDMIKNK